MSRSIIFQMLTLMPLALAGVGSAPAETPAKEQIIAAVKQHHPDVCVTRPPLRFKNEVRRFIESSRTRDLLVESRQPPAEGKPRPKINFDDIRFESNSAIPKKTSPDWVLVIAAALEQMEMKDQLVVLIGHADARGSKAYNHMLSERRAEAVKRLLIENFGVPADRLAAIGFGKTCLKNPSSPYAPENRRLHIVSVPLS